MKKLKKKITDAFVNSMTKMGYGKQSETGWNTEAGYMPEQTLTDMYCSRESWLFRKIVDVPVDDAFPGGIELSSEDEKVDAMQELVKKIKLMSKLKETMKTARLYGGAAIIPVTDDTGEPAREMTQAGEVRELYGLTVADGMELMPSEYYDDPTRPEYGDVELYDYMPYIHGGSAAAVRKIHSSRIIPLVGDAVPKRKTGRLLQHPWGQSVIASVYSAVKNYDTADDQVTNIINEYLVKVMKMPALMDLLQAGSEDDIETLENRIEMMNLMMSGHNLHIIGDDEDLQKYTVNISGLEKLVDKLRESVSGASGIPIQRLVSQQMGTLAGAKEGTKTYLDLLTRVQDSARPGVQKILDMAAAVTGVDSYTWNFESVAKPTQSEVVETRKKQAETDQIYWNTGAITSEEIRQSRFSGEYSIETSIDEGLDMKPFPDEEEEE